MAFYTLQKLAGWLDPATWTRLSTVSNSVLLAEFAGASGQLARIAWNTSNAAQTVTLPIGPVAQTRITTLLPLTWNDNSATWLVQTNNLSNGMLTFTVSNIPVAVEALGFVALDLDGDGVANADDDDADGDGMPDEWEAAHGLSPFANDRHLDPDEDGQANGDEQWAGTDPQSASSCLALSGLSGTGTNVNLHWAASSGRVYRVAQSQAVAGPWSDGLEYLGATGSVMSWRNPGPALTSGFFRILGGPAP